MHEITVYPFGNSKIAVPQNQQFQKSVRANSQLSKLQSSLVPRTISSTPGIVIIVPELPDPGSRLIDTRMRSDLSPFGPFFPLFCFERSIMRKTGRENPLPTAINNHHLSNLRLIIGYLPPILSFNVCLIISSYFYAGSAIIEPRPMNYSSGSPFRG